VSHLPMSEKRNKMKPMKIHEIYETKQNYISKANDMTGKKRKKKNVLELPNQCHAFETYTLHAMALNDGLCGKTR
jgi:hypothetical protein